MILLFSGYTFKNRGLLQLAMTHPSYKENYGTNPDHSRNTLSNCGIRQPEYGDRRVHSASNRKRGINMLINIMSRFGKKDETESKVQHNERLEVLGGMLGQINMKGTVKSGSWWRFLPGVQKSL